MERRGFLAAWALAPLATVKPRGDYEQAEENGWTFIFWGWRDRPDATFVSAFWTAHKDDVHCVSVVKQRDAIPWVGRYYKGYVFNISDSLYPEDARKRGIREFTQDEYDRVFAEEKQIALNRLREYVRDTPIEEMRTY